MSPFGRGPKRRPVTRSLRRGVAAALILVLAVFLALFLTRGKKPASVSPPEKAASAQKIDERNQVHYVEYRGEKEKTEFQADRNFVGPDGKYHLVGHVQVTDYGRQGGRKVLVRCDEIIHDAERTRFSLLGHVRMEFEEATFETESLEYDRKLGLFTTGKPIAITSPHFKGTALGLDYSLKSEELRLLAEVVLETQVSKGSPLPLIFQSKTLFYSRPVRKGRFEGGVTFSHGRSHGSAETADFQLFYDTDKLDIIDFKGQVRLFLDGEFTDRSKAGASNSLLTLGEKQNVQADALKLRAFINTSRLHSYESSGNVSMTFLSSTKGNTRFQGASIDFIFEQDGGLREFRASTDVHMLKTEPQGGETQSVEGDSMLLPGNSDILQVKAGKGRTVRAGFRGNEITASVLGFNLKNEDLQAAEVKAVFSPTPERRTVGLFTAQEPMFVTSHWMKYTSETRRYRFYGGLKMWQDKSALYALEVELQEDTGATVCSGNVRSLFPHKPKDQDKEEQVEVTSQKMNYDPDKNTAVYEKEAAMKATAFRLKGERITVLLSKETKDPERMTAQVNVVINQDQPVREGKGEQALYLVDDRLVVLTGHPLLTEKDKGEVQGDKLTFHLADGSITVENDTRDRSVTKIKS
jgi:lipopolysaccharide transport protein LptA/LPS export ABC transporter protein LptC